MGVIQTLAMINAMRGGSGGGGGGSGGGGGGSSDGFPIGDGNTHIWISLGEGRTSPVLGIGVNGTATVDWGDGTEPDVLTGTNIAVLKETPTHNYAAPGEYVITLTADGEIGFVGYSHLLSAFAGGSDKSDYAYWGAVRKIECGSHVSMVGGGSFQYYSALESIVFSDDATQIARTAFDGCYSLRNIVFPDSVTKLDNYTLRNCASLQSVGLPSGLTEMSESVFNGCFSLTKVVVPSSVVRITYNTFTNCYGVRVYDFSKCTAVPSLLATSAFTNIPTDCEIRVPAALVDEWKAATNWSTYADKIVGV